MIYIWRFAVGVGGLTLKRAIGAVVVSGLVLVVGSGPASASRFTPQWLPVKTGAAMYGVANTYYWCTPVSDLEGVNPELQVNRSGSWVVVAVGHHAGDLAGPPETSAVCPASAPRIITFDWTPADLGNYVGHPRRYSLPMRIVTPERTTQVPQLVTSTVVTREVKTVAKAVKFRKCVGKPKRMRKVSYVLTAPNAIRPVSVSTKLPVCKVKGVKAKRVLRAGVTVGSPHTITTTVQVPGPVIAGRTLTNFIRTMYPSEESFWTDVYYTQMCGFGEIKYCTM